MLLKETFNGKKFNTVGTKMDKEGVDDCTRIFHCKYFVKCFLWLKKYLLRYEEKTGSK